MTRSLEDTRCYDRIAHVYFDLGRLQDYCWTDLAMFGIGYLETWEEVKHCDMCRVEPYTYCGKEASGGGDEDES